MEAAVIVGAVTAIANLIVTAAPLVIEAKENAKPFAEAIVNMLKGSVISPQTSRTFLKHFFSHYSSIAELLITMERKHYHQTEHILTTQPTS